MATISGKTIDKETGETVEARVQALSSGGQFLHPKDAILKVGPGVPFFYCDGEFTVDPPRGMTQIPGLCDHGPSVRGREGRRRAIDRSITEALERVSRHGRLQSDQQRREVVTPFREGQEVFKKQR